ncbi:hypothetical protein [Halomicrobium katesii]|uniref:hypothetical protein n=1 Tax=Halomicrobium katesii TaxID=437163 RepID=UPI000377DD7D|nr:hypothetical protein [Halomicrobium katesii]
MSFSIPNAPVVHLYQQTKQNLEEGTVTDFQHSLIEFSRTFGILLDHHSQSDSGVPRFKDRVQDILERHIELYRLALSGDMIRNFRYPLISTFTSNLRTAIQQEDFRAADEVVKAYIKCFQIELESESSEELLQYFADRLQNPAIDVKQSFQDSESSQDVALFQEKAEHIHGVYRSAGKAAIESNNLPALELILESRREHFDIADIRVPIYPHEDSDIPIEIRKKKNALTERYENQELIFLFVLMSWAHRHHDKESEDWSEILDFLLDEITSEVKSFRDVAELVKKVQESEDMYWERWQDQENLFDSIGVSSGSMATHTWIRDGYAIVIGNVMRTGEGALVPDVDLSKSEIPNEEWYLDYETKIENAIDNLRKLPEQPTYLIQQFGRSIPKVRGEALLDLHNQLVTELENKRRERWLQSDLDSEEVKEYIRGRQQGYTDGVTLRKRLFDRGNWEIRDISTSDLEGVLLVQYSEPRVRFLSDAPSPPQSRGSQALISAGLYRYLGRRVFEKRRVSSQAELEKEIKEALRRSPDNQELFIAEGTDHRLFGGDDEYDPFVRGDAIKDQIGSIGSHPVFKDFMHPYDAVVLSEGDTRIVEIGSEPMIVNISVAPGEKANLGSRFKGDPSAVDRSHAVISVRVRLGIWPGSTLGTAYLIEE